MVKHLEQLLLPVHQVPGPCPSDSLRLLQLFYYKWSLIRVLRLMGALASNFLLFSAALGLVYNCGMAQWCQEVLCISLHGTSILSTIRLDFLS